jgi:hypothetical protein
MEKVIQQLSRWLLLGFLFLLTLLFFRFCTFLAVAVTGTMIGNGALLELCPCPIKL